MVARRYDIKVEAGANFQLVIDVSETGTAQPLIGASARMEVRQYREASSPVLLGADSTSGSIVLNTGASQVQIDIPYTDLEAITWDTAWYDVELTRAGKRWRLIEGRALASPQVTQG